MEPPVAFLCSVLFIELTTVAAALELKPLLEAASIMHYLPRYLHKDFELAYADPSFFQTADMMIDVANDESLPVHSALMRIRCPFFDTLYAILLHQ